MNIDNAINTDDVARFARRYLPRIAYDFIDGGVDGEDGLRHNREAFQRYRLVPRYLVDVERRSQATSLFGQTYASPFGISPMSIAGFFRPGADLMIARAAAALDVPYIMSSASCSSIESAVAEAPKNTWFQVYGTRDPEITVDLIARATSLNVRVLILTVDTPVIGKRERNIRNGFRRPMKMTPGVILQGLRRPVWTWRYLMGHGIPLMENWAPYAPPGADAPPGRRATTVSWLFSPRWRACWSVGPSPRSRSTTSPRERVFRDRRSTSISPPRTLCF